ncbi:MAG TPA: hypothetical protein VNZ45_03840 [Bacteroidia bacterium]|jgi:hypothetical protein|nr:hypothetical protein [Bacteroidia bacterium]
MGYPYDLFNSVDNNRLAVVNELSYWNSANTSGVTVFGVGSAATLSTASGVLDKVVINSPGIYNFTLFDGGTQLAQITATGGIATNPFVYGAKTNSGLAITVASLSGNITIVGR